MNYHKKWREKRKKRGLCVNCAKPTRPGRVHCAACAGQKAAADKVIRARRRSEDLCTACGRWPAVPGHTKCPGCRSKAAEYSRRRQERLRRAGTCPRCGKRATAAGRSACKKCLARHRAWVVSLDVQAKDARGSRCEVCGWDARPDLLEWHHWRRVGARKPPKKNHYVEMQEVISGKDKALCLACPICHRRLHADRLEFNPRTRKTRKRR